MLELAPQTEQRTGPDATNKHAHWTTRMTAQTMAPLTRNRPLSCQYTVALNLNVR
jgi:hypothetical protein